MATPTGPRAQAARAFYRVRRRKLKQEETRFALLAATPHNFGAVASNASAPNNLALPGAGRFAVSFSAALPLGGAAIFDATGPLQSFFNPVSAVAGGRVEIRHWFERNQTIGVFRPVGTLPGTLSVYYLGPMNKPLLIGTATFS